MCTRKKKSVRRSRLEVFEGLGSGTPSTPSTASTASTPSTAVEQEYPELRLSGFGEEVGDMRRMDLDEKNRELRATSLDSGKGNNVFRVSSFNLGKENPELRVPCLNVVEDLNMLNCEKLNELQLDNECEISLSSQFNYAIANNIETISIYRDGPNLDIDNDELILSSPDASDYSCNYILNKIENNINCRNNIISNQFLDSNHTLDIMNV